MIDTMKNLGWEGERLRKFRGIQEGGEQAKKRSLTVLVVAIWMVPLCSGDERRRLKK